jgi:hypothetical protein
MLLKDHLLRRTDTAYTISYALIDFFPHKRLLEVLREFPDDAVQFRKNHLWLTMLRGLQFMGTHDGLLPFEWRELQRDVAQEEYGRMLEQEPLRGETAVSPALVGSSGSLDSDSASGVTQGEAQPQGPVHLVPLTCRRGSAAAIAKVRAQYRRASSSKITDGEAQTTGIDLIKAKRELRRVSAAAGVSPSPMHGHPATTPIEGTPAEDVGSVALTSFGGSLAPEATQTGTGTGMAAELKDALAAQSAIFDERLAKAMAAQRSHFDEQAAAQRSHFEEQIQQVLSAMSGTRAEGTS